MNPGMFSAEVETDVVRPNTELLNYIKRIRDALKKVIIPMDFAMDLIKKKQWNKVLNNLQEFKR
jgi:hypothetical protein